MAQQSKPADGYITVTIQLSNTAARLVDLIKTQLNKTVPPTCQEYQIQTDPEDTSNNNVRLGDGSLGTTIGGFVQKGVTLLSSATAGGSSETTRTGVLNGKNFGSVYGQTVTGTQLISIQLWIF
jgi:hypothetical protein